MRVSSSPMSYARLGASSWPSKSRGGASSARASETSPARWRGRCSKSLPPTPRTSTSRKMSAEMVARGDEPLPDSPEEIRRALTNREAYEIVPSQEYLIELSLASVRELTNIFFQMSWKLLRFGKDCLFT